MFEHKTAEGFGSVDGQVPLQCSVDVAQNRHAVDDETAILLWRDLRHVGRVVTGEFSNDFFKDIF